MRHSNIGTLVSYSAAVSKTCNAALASKKTQAVFMKVADTNEIEVKMLLYRTWRMSSFRNKLRMF